MIRPATNSKTITQVLETKTIGPGCHNQVDKRGMTVVATSGSPGAAATALDADVESIKLGSSLPSGFRSLRDLRSRARSARRLAVWAEVCAALSDHFALDRRAAVGTGLVFQPIDAPLLLVVALATIGWSEISQCRTAFTDCLAQSPANRGVQALHLLVRQFGCRSQRMDAGQKQRFIGVDIAQAGHHGLVK